MSSVPSPAVRARRVQMGWRAGSVVVALALSGWCGQASAQDAAPRTEAQATDAMTNEALTGFRPRWRGTQAGLPAPAPDQQYISPTPVLQPAQYQQRRELSPPVLQPVQYQYRPATTTPLSFGAPAPLPSGPVTPVQLPNVVGQAPPPPPPPAAPMIGAPTVPPAPGAPVAEDTAVPGADLPEGTEAPPSGGGDNFPVWASYRYNPGGGYLHFGDPNDEYTVNFQEQVTLDGTFYNRANVATTEKGFNIPFYRAFAFGNITKDWNYQASVQAFLGSFNILDLWLDHQFCDAVHFRFGRMLTPFLYEYYGFSPAWEPVITNSPLFQVAGKRQLGGMFWGKLFENRAQYQAGVFNGTAGSFFDTNNSVDFIGAFDVTPFKGSGNQMLDSLGGGIGVQTGRQNALLSAGSGLNFINGAGEPTLNPSFIGSTGLPFLVYNPDVAMNGMQTKVAPHLYWFGQFSVLAEYVYMDRTLTSIAVPKGISIVQGYYVNTSYFLTGERYSGDGLGGYTVISPLRPFIPSKGIYGPGAWELAAQFSQLHVGSSDFANGFVSPVFRASQLSQLMLGVNWWMNKYTRVSFDWVNARTNAAVPLAPGAVPTNQYNIFWTRLAMFF